MSFLRADGRCTIIAEVGANHGGDLDRACDLVRQAKQAGADVVKFQFYDPSEMAYPCHGWRHRIDWQGQSTSLWDLYTMAGTPSAWIPDVLNCAESHSMPVVVSVFSKETAQKVVDDGRIVALKVASTELTYHDLIWSLGSLWFPVIISTGAASDNEIAQLAEIDIDMYLMHCVAKYPTRSDQVALRCGYNRLAEIASRRSYVREEIGFSDHTTSIYVPVYAAAMGYAFIEKHFRGNPQPFEDKMVDHSFSLDGSQFRRMVWGVREAEGALYGPIPEQLEARAWRRRWVAKDNLVTGLVLGPERITALRCNAPEAIGPDTSIVGRTVARDIAAGTPITADMLR